MASPANRWPPHPAQEGLLAAGPATTANCAFAYQADRTVDPDRLAAAYRTALSHFDALRLSLDVDSGYWTAADHVRASVTVHSRPVEDAASATAQRISAPMSATHASVGAVHLEPLPDGSWLITETFTHLIADGRSLALLHDLVSTHYRSTAPRHTSDAPTETSPSAYRDLLDAAAARSGGDRWWNGPADFEPMRLPADPAATDTRRRRLRYNRAQTMRLTQAASNTRATLATATLAAHLHALARYTGHGDVATHLAIDTRPPGHSAVFGQATQLIPVRVRHRWDEPVSRHLHHLTRHLFDLRQHVPVTLNELDRTGALLSITDASSAVFIFQDSPVRPPHLLSTTTTILDMPDLHNAGGIVTVAHCHNNEMTIELRTPPGSALHQHLDGIATTVDTFLTSVVTTPDCRLGADELLPPHDRTVITHLAEPALPLPGPAVTATLLDGDPSRLALIEKGRHFRAAELASETHRRRAALTDAGIQPGDAVVVDDHTAFGRITSFLAVLDCGAVYIPVTADTPESQRGDIVAQAEATHTLADGCVAITGTRPATPGADMLGTSSSSPPGHAPAYVIFTSGSTGQPKGVVVTRAGLANLAHGEAGRYDIRPADRVLLCAPPTTDPWICHVTGTLLARAALVATDLFSNQSLTEQLIEHAVTHAFLPAVLFEDCSHAADTLIALRVVATAGDRCRGDAVARYRKHPRRRVFNIYGPTETTVTATIAELSGPSRTAHDVAPIGAPIAGVGARVVIEQAATAPAGVPGELMLSGTGLALGYLGNPEETRRRFPDDPFRPGNRWYRTGDRAWFSTDGDLYVDGRLDRQVKIRGFRIEPDHLETEALASGLCNAAYALGRTTPSGDIWLHLFVETCPDAGQLRQHLHDSLPSQLRPGRITVLAQLPRTAAGKIDGAKLLIHAATLDTAPAGREADETTALDPVASAWAQLLGHQPVPSEDFFVAGGDSLQALQLVRLIREAGCTITPADIYKHRTASAIAAAATIGAPVPQTGGRSIAAPLGPSQQWFFQLGLAEPNRWCQHRWLPFKQLPNDTNLTTAMHQIATDTPILTAFITADGIRYPQKPHLPDVDVHMAPLDDAALATLVEQMYGSSAPATGRMLHAAAIRQPDGSGVLLLTAHHLAVDDWSWRLIEDRIRASLAGAARRTDDGYARYSAAVTRQRQAGAFHLDNNRWQHILGTGITTNTLASNTTNVRNSPTGPGRKTMTADLGTDMATLTRRWSAPAAAVVLTALGHALHTIEPGQISVIDLERNGRTALSDIDLSDTVGWLALHHPLPLPHRAAGSPAAAYVSRFLETIPDDGLSYHTRWQETPFSRRGLRNEPAARFAVNIADNAPGDTNATGPTSELLDRLRRCSVPSNSPHNQLPYDASLVFRTGHHIHVELTYERNRLSDADAAALLNGLKAAVAENDWLTGSAVPCTSPGSPFTVLPVSAMQHLMLYRAAAGPGVYLPRQLLSIEDLPDEEAFIADLQVLLGRLDPFRRRITPARDGTLRQHVERAALIPLRYGSIDELNGWIVGPDTIDADAARNGAALATAMVFGTGTTSTLHIGMQIHHAVIDGHGNGVLQQMIGMLADRHRRHRRHQPVTQLIGEDDRSHHVAYAKHVSAELRDAGKIADFRDLEPNPQLQVHAVGQAELSAAQVTELTAWAHRERTDLRAVLAAAAFELARSRNELPVYLVGNGRTADIGETLTAFGLYWYFMPTAANSGGFSDLVFRDSGFFT